MYHFFPEGKAELGAETIRWSGAIYGRLIDLFYEQGADPVAATRSFFEGAADTVRDTDYADACPIATVALEVASTSEPLRQATAEVFESWLAAIDVRLVESGLTRTQARNLSVVAVLVARRRVHPRSGHAGPHPRAHRRPRRRRARRGSAREARDPGEPPPAKLTVTESPEPRARPRTL